MYQYDKDSLKETLTIDQIADLVNELGGEPQVHDSYFIAKTICHNEHGEGSHKLYYYDNTKLFKCYTGCESDGAFDIYELVHKVKKIQLPQAIEYVAKYFGFSASDFDFPSLADNLQDWQILNNYERIKDINSKKQIVQFKTVSSDIIKYLPLPKIIPWEKEGISVEAMKHCHICYNPVSHAIVIPHYDIDGNLIGIRERTLVEENEQYGKYRPAYINGTMYNHPLGFNLYNLNNSKGTVSIFQKAIIFEGEKSCLLYQSYFGIDNDITCACCGCNLTNYQIQLLLNIGVKEIIIGFDKQFKEIGDDEWKKWTTKLTNFHNRFGGYCKISFLFDKYDLLTYKASPIDAGKDMFLELFKERVML